MISISKIGGMLRALLPNMPTTVSTESGNAGNRSANAGSENATASTETGTRLREDARYRNMYRHFYVDPEVREAIIAIRQMDKLDGRVKMIHSRVARDIIKGGLVMQLAKPDKAA